jgi:hypothetical protein
MRTRTHATLVLSAALLSGVSAACARQLQLAPTYLEQKVSIDELWQAPADLEQRDLFLGPGGEQLAPKNTSFTFVAEDASGWSPGFDVRDAKGIEWSVKLGPESQSEIATSRILWAVGYHQPPTYYLDQWTLAGSPNAAQNGTQKPGRFRPELPGRTVVGDWSWYENPFIGSRPYRGLVVVNLIMTNWDWKTSNNKVYELSEPVRGVQRWFVVRDVGASLGTFTYPTVLKWFRLRGFGQGTRNDLPGFEAQGFIKEIDEQGDVTFHYRGIYRDVINSVAAADVRWACEQLSRLSDRQWQDAFRAGGFTPEQTARYVKKIKEKIDQGLTLTQPLTR